MTGQATNSFVVKVAMNSQADGVLWTVGGYRMMDSCNLGVAGLKASSKFLERGPL